MYKKLRDSGIEAIGDVYWGTHIGQLYNSKDDFFNVASPYIRSGLLNNELCLWVYSQNTNEEEIISNLNKYVENVDNYLKSGQLLLIPYNEWYYKDNSFNEVRTNENWIEYINKSIEQEYVGLRAAADTFWLEKGYYRTFEQYEKNVNKLIPELPFIVLCLYDENRTDKLQFAEIINNHGFTIISVDNKLEIIKNVELLLKDKQLSNALEYNRLKTEFFANLSHELRTPLNVILGAVQMMELKKRNKDEKEETYLKLMKQNCYRLVRLINNLIDMTKIDADYYEIHKKNLDIVNLVEDITMSVAEYAFSKNIKIIFDTEIEEMVIACDPDQIERIILNLLSNAIKFTPIGGEISVLVNDSNEKVNISVKDSGIGIPIDKQENIFDRFVQVDKSLTRNQEGSGIGLSLVKALVEKHEGSIYVNSELNRGSEFVVELPCKKLAELSDMDDMANPKVFDHVERAKIEFSDIYSIA